MLELPTLGNLARLDGVALDQLTFYIPYLERIICCQFLRTVDHLLRNGFTLRAQSNYIRRKSQLDCRAILFLTFES